MSIARHTVVSYANDSHQICYGLTVQDSERIDVQVEVYPLRNQREYFGLNVDPVYIAKKDILLPYRDASILGKAFLENGNISKTKVMITKNMAEGAAAKLHQKFPMMEKDEPTGLGKRKPENIKTTARSSKLGQKKYLVDINKKVLTEREIRQKNLPHFARNATTNFRFDLGQILKGADKEPRSLDFGRVMSTNLQRMDSEKLAKGSVNKKKVLDAAYEFATLALFICQQPEEAASYIQRKDFGVYPSPSETQQIQKSLTSLENNLKKMPESIEFKLIAKLSFLWTLTFKFLSSANKQKMANLMDLLQQEPTECTEVSVMKQLQQHANTIVELSSRIACRLDEFYWTQSISLKADIAVMIVRYDLRDYGWVKLFEKLYTEIIAERVDLKTMETVHLEILAYLKFNDKMEVIGKQTNYYAAFLKHKVSEQIGVTAAFWAKLTDTATKYIRRSMADRCAELANSQEDLIRMADSITKAKTGLPKAINLCTLKICIGDHLVMDCMNKRNHEVINSILINLLESENKLPLIVYFIQTLNHKSGNFKKFEGIGYTAIDKFIERFMTLSGNEKIAEFQILSRDYQQYVTYRDRLCYAVSWNNLAEFTKILEETFKEPYSHALNTTFGCFSNARAFESQTDKLKKFFIYTLLNEVYLPRILEVEPEIITKFMTLISQTKDILVKLAGQRFADYIQAVAFNFSGLPQMSMTPLLIEDGIRSRMTIVHQISTYFKINVDGHILSLNDRKVAILTDIEQLATLPTDDEDNTGFIANIAYKTQTGLRGGLDVTSLNQCGCGFLYFIGNCGRPAFERQCPSCNITIGGLGHKFSNENNKQITFIEFLEKYQEKERPLAMVYQKRDLDTQGQPVIARYMQDHTHFRFVELCMHSRYIAELLLEGDQEKERLANFINVDDSMDPIAATAEYLVKVCTASLSMIENELRSATAAYAWINTAIQDMRYLAYNLPVGYNSTSIFEGPLTRNIVEHSLASEIKQNYTSWQSYVDAVKSEVKAVEASALGCKRLVHGWISKMATFQDFASAELEIDLRIITGLRLENHVSLAQLQKNLVDNYPDPDKFELLKFALHYEPVLKIFSAMFSDQLELARYVQSKFEYEITWSQACRLSINDLCSEKTSSLIIDERDDDVVNRLGKDRRLECLFKNAARWWTQINRLRDDFADVFDFRFLCHGTTLPEEKIAELTDISRAKVAFYLVDDKHVESLFMPSIIQTFAKFQNSTLQKFKSTASKINGKNQFQSSIKVQAATASHIISLQRDLEQIVEENAFTDARFNRDTELVFDFNHIETAISESMFMGKCRLTADEDSLETFCYLFNFNKIKNILSTINQDPTPTNIQPAQKALLLTLARSQPEHIYSHLAKAIHRVAADKSGQTLGMPIATDTTTAMHAASITVDQLGECLAIVCEATYNRAVVELDLMFCQPIDADIMPVIEAGISDMRDDEKRVLATGLKHVILEQLSGCSSEAVSKSSLSQAIEYSDVFDNLELSKDTLKAIPEEVTLGQAVAYAQILLSYDMNNIHN